MTSNRILDVAQGSPEWHAERAISFCASEAPAMMGASKYMKRQELLRQKAGGIKAEVDSFTQSLFDRGHETEALARVVMESIIGEELYPATVVIDDYEGMRLLASLDGQTISGEKIFEHKLWNEELAAAVRAGNLDPHYYWQLEHELLVGEADVAIFTTSNGTAEQMEFAEYRSVPERRAQLIAGWHQFADDLNEALQSQPEPAAVEVSAKPIKELPGLSVMVVGEVKSSNLAIYRANAIDFIKSINKDLKTDQDFADAENVIKFCDSAEKELELAKKAVLAQTVTIDEVFRTVDDIKEQLRRARLDLEKLVKSKKEEIRADVKGSATRAWAAYIQELNDGLGGLTLPNNLFPDFEGAMKSKKTMRSLSDGCADALAKAKIEVSKIANTMRANHEVFKTEAAGFEHVFPDLNSLCQKAKDDFLATVRMRVADAKRREDEKAQQAAAAAAQQPAPAAPIATPAPAAPAKQPAKAKRPKVTDEQIVELVAAHFGTPLANAAARIAEIDHKRMAELYGPRKVGAK